MSVTLNAEARARLDKHLDAVEAALVAAGNLREQRRGVLDDLEAQILDMLVARSATPTVEDVNAVLAKLDPPAAYGEGGSARERNEFAQPADAVKPKSEGMNKGLDLKRRNFMRSSVAIVLVVCGMLLVMTPGFSDYFHERNLITLVTTTSQVAPGIHVSGVAMMSDACRFGCWLTGSLAILCGVIGGFVAFARERRHG